MNNLEFYKDEIINSSITEVFIKYTRRVQHSHGECIDWLCEEHQILDKEEKEYLSAVIKPFRDRVTCVSKNKYNEHYAYLVIAYRETDYVQCIYFPFFKSSTMYKGMMLERYYTLEELGL